MTKRNIAVAKKNTTTSTTEKLKSVEATKTAGKVLNELDKVIHERMRLGIISALAANKKLSFSELKKLLNTTDGNISVHSRKLEDAGYLKCLKSFKGRVPLTEYKITKKGRNALEKYLDHMEALINAIKRGK